MSCKVTKKSFNNDLKNLILDNNWESLGIKSNLDTSNSKPTTYVDRVEIFVPFDSSNPNKDILFGKLKNLESQINKVYQSGEYGNVIQTQMKSDGGVISIQSTDKLLNALNEQYSGEQDPSDNLSFSPREEEVKYSFKATENILKNLPKVNQWYKQLGNTDKFWNKLQQDLQIPKEQIILLKESEGNTIEEKLTSFAANYSYTVEINTAKEKPYLTRNDIYYSPNNKGKYEIFEGKNLIKTVETLKQAEKEIEELNKKPTQHYSNLTVPGGTNYTEQEIATPAITPSIKGHAAFSTDSGIGWFRADESQQYQETDIQSIIDNLQKSGQLEINCK